MTIDPMDWFSTLLGWCIAAFQLGRWIEVRRSRLELEEFIRRFKGDTT